MAECHGTLTFFHLFHSVLLLFVLRNLGQQDDDESEGEDAQSRVHQREDVANLGINDAGNEQARDNDDSGTTQGVE